MTSSEVRPDGQKSTLATWRTRIIGALAVVAVLVIAYFILAAFIPRWWAQRLAELVSGSFSKGIGWGLVYGVLGTALPLFLLLSATLVWKRRAGKFIAGAAALLAVITAIPNLMTLSIVLGGNSAAHAGQRILDVDAPAFRGASLVGAIVAVVVFLAAVFLIVARRRRRKHPGESAAPKPPPAVAPQTPTVTPDTSATRQQTL
ncbi:permease [Nocardia sp. NBC_00565]|uniref:permease n=1 Tax=Nocardia sp. NBC_00565 TaxID=2975993 RepID=UPI002E7FB5A9|nr:permease [Nocardia sp. NBC_00565]WUC04485.1 permease [Nocardia sp. NBC_00565]